MDKKVVKEQIQFWGRRFETQALWSFIPFSVCYVMLFELTTKWILKSFSLFNISIDFQAVQNGYILGVYMGP